MSLPLAALRTRAVRALLVLACGLGAASLIFAVWSLPHATSQPAPQAFALSSAFFPFFAIALTANGIITTREIPKAQRDPLSMNAALYRRSSRRVKVSLATMLTLGVPLAATGVAAKAPTALVGGVSLEFYVITIGMLVALLPEPLIGTAHGAISATPRQSSSAP